ncbi:response regulator transcription factor [Brevibacillus laterosporus]|uniref:response regulator transcription factor n=1 Tax=Brevibacillus laterosporus TaxID=1465 RepID=UPI003D219BB0
MTTIMIIEDDPKIAEMLKEHIERYKYHAVVVRNFDLIMESFLEWKPDMVLLDINLPSFDGYYWCRQLRLVSTCPIVFISARSAEMDQVMALEHGADDYITKPFHYELVMAKIRSHLRRAYGDYAPKIEERTVEHKGLCLYPERLEVRLQDEVSLLTKKEAILLEALLTAYPRVSSRTKLLDKLWDDQAYVDDNTLSVNITRLRKKLAELGIEDAIETVRGAGYRLQITWNHAGGSR